MTMGRAIIRPAVPGDIPALQKLQKEELPDADGSVVPRKSWLEYIGSGFTVVAELDGKTVGFVSGEPLLDAGAIIHFFIIDKKHRGTRLTGALCDGFEERLRQSGVEWVHGYAEPRAAMFYKRRGASLGHELIETLKYL